MANPNEGDDVIIEDGAVVPEDGAVASEAEASYIVSLTDDTQRNAMMISLSDNEVTLYVAVASFPTNFKGNFYPERILDLVRECYMKDPKEFAAKAKATPNFIEVVKKCFLYFEGQLGEKPIWILNCAFLFHEDEYFQNLLHEMAENEPDAFFELLPNHIDSMEPALAEELIRKAFKNCYKDRFFNKPVVVDIFLKLPNAADMLIELVKKQVFRQDYGQLWKILGTRNFEGIDRVAEAWATMAAKDRNDSGVYCDEGDDWRGRFAERVPFSYVPGGLKVEAGVEGEPHRNVQLATPADQRKMIKPQWLGDIETMEFEGSLSDGLTLFLDDFEKKYGTSALEEGIYQCFLREGYDVGTYLCIVQYLLTKDWGMELIPDIFSKTGNLCHLKQEDISKVLRALPDDMALDILEKQILTDLNPDQIAYLRPWSAFSTEGATEFATEDDAKSFFDTVITSSLQLLRQRFSEAKKPTLPFLLAEVFTKAEVVFNDHDPIRKGCFLEAFYKALWEWGVAEGYGEFMRKNMSPKEFFYFMSQLGMMDIYEETKDGENRNEMHARESRNKENRRAWDETENGLPKVFGILAEIIPEIAERAPKEFISRLAEFENLNNLAARQDEGFVGGRYRFVAKGPEGAQLRQALRQIVQMADFKEDELKELPRQVIVYYGSKEQLKTLFEHRLSDGQDNFEAISMINLILKACLPLSSREMAPSPDTDPRVNILKDFIDDESLLEDAKRVKFFSLLLLSLSHIQSHDPGVEALLPMLGEERMKKLFEILLETDFDNHGEVISGAEHLTSRSAQIMRQFSGNEDLNGLAFEIPEKALKALRDQVLANKASR